MAMTSDIGVDEEIGVELKTGLDLRSLPGGALFEIKEPDNRGADFENCPQSYENYPEEELLKYAKSELLAVSSDDELDDVERSPFEKMRLEMEDISPEGDKSICKQLKRPGFGDALPEGAMVTVHYNAYLDLSAEPFDSTYMRSKAHSFRLGAAEVILGLDIAVRSMKVRERSEFLIAPDYAYGEQGCLNRIPPASSILFVVEVISCVDNSAIVEFNNLTLEERSTASFQELMKVAHAEHLTGKNSEKKKMCDKALKTYLRATRLLQNATYSNDTEEAEVHSVLLKLYVNISRLSYSFKKYRKCCKYGDEALKIDPKCVKALYWVGCACTQLCNWEGAMTNLSSARKVDPKGCEIMKALETLDKKKKAADNKERDFYKKMFPGAAVKSVKPKVEIEDDFLKTVVEVLASFRANDDIRDPLVLECTDEEAACIQSEVDKYADLEVFKSDDSIKICKRN